MRGLRQFSAHLTKCHACHGIGTLSPLHAALTMRSAKTSCACHAKWRWWSPKCCACHEKCNASSENFAKALPATQKRLSTRYETRLNVTKCHACHAKRSNATFETSKCRTYYRHGHTALTRTVGDGCGRLRTVAQRRANTPSTRMQTPRVKREPLLRIQEKGKIQMLYGFEPVHLR